MALLTAMLCSAGTGDARTPQTITTTDTVLEHEMSRAIVLRSVRMPDPFGQLILELDAEARRIDRQSAVSDLTDADVWVIGLSGWSDLEWLRKSPLYKRFAARLQRADPGARFKSFQWKVASGRQLDLHFVNLDNTGGMTVDCLAALVYTLSHRAVDHRRVVDLSVLRSRALPISRLTAAGIAGGNSCD